jgi:hypothetical protein
MLGDDRDGVIARERRLAGEHLVEQGAEGVEVARRAGGIAQCLFRR